MNLEKRIRALDDKKSWGPGPWQDEPDRLEFECAGLPCLLVRNTQVTGVWCGYVAVPPGHPFHGKDYQSIDHHADVHGGLTYSDKCQGKVCHVPKKGEPDNVWWLGFDCGHFDDVSPRLNATMTLMRKMMKEPGRAFLGSFGTYKTMAYAKRETQKLARQLASLHA